MIRWTLPALHPPQRWQSRAEIRKGYLDSLSQEKLRDVDPSYYWLHFGLPAWQRECARKYDPDQPRVAAGSPDGGRWASGDHIQAARDRMAYVIRVCIISGVSRTTDTFGNKSWRATYDCAGGRSFVREGSGHTPPGLVLDPFR
jgi:hypothetical protein